MKNKNGFTLIELLAVILILGIIALIAIPTVNKIIDEARYGAFKTTSENVINAVEQECQISSMKGKFPNLLYIITDGKINNNIDVKGEIPNDGYIILDNNCAITSYYLTTNKYSYANEEDIRSDYMLKKSDEELSIFKKLYPSYYNKIKKINFINNLNIPNNAIEIKDPSISEKGKIKSWLVPDNENYELFIGSEKKIYANFDSSYLFFQSYAETLDTSNLYTDLTSIFYKSFSETKFKSLNLNNLNTSNANNMMSMFANSENLMMLEISNFKTNNVNNSQYMFYNCKVLENLDLSLWDTSNITDMRYMFYGCNALKKINSGNWDTSKVKSFIHMFNGCYNLKLEVSEWNTSNVESIGYMFVSCNNNNVLDLSKWDVKKVKNIDSLFWGLSNLEILNLSNWNLKNVNSEIYDVFTNSNINNIVIQNSNYNTINTIIEYLEDGSGTLNIKGVDDISKVDTTTATSKNWNIIS